MSVTAVDLESLALFQGCTGNDLRPFVEAVSASRHAVAGEVICEEGDKADRWWIVADGLADVTIDGLYLATIGAGETIGELALLDGEPRAATVTAVTDMHLHEVDGNAFIDVLLGSPRVSVALLRELAMRLRATNLRPARPSRPTPTFIPAHTEPPAVTTGPQMFDPRTPGYTEDPAVHFSAIRDAAAVHWSDAISSFVVTRYDDVLRLSRSRALVGSVSTMDHLDLAGAGGAATRPRAGHRMMIRRDGEDHTRLRRLMSKAFTPRSIAVWQERSELIVERLLDAAAEREHLDVIADYALCLPAQVISEMLGMPTEDTADLRDWSRTLTRGLDPFSTTEEQDASAEAGRAIADYVIDVIADKRIHPGDDILSTLLAAEDAGDVLDDKEVVAQVVMLYIAGHETTLNLIGNGVTHLFRFPDELERLRANPDLDANAVEEVLRFESPAQLTRRVCLEPLNIDDVVIPAGSHITLALASANRDPRKWGPTADVLDVARPGAHEHVSFGGGAHFCLGAALARLEARIALPRLVRRFPKMAPAYDEPAWAPRVTLRGVETLPVTLR